ncbi:MAG TPA: restriction endonuclease [Thermoleophilaceae bacterium]|nr:restriction endonuclease [Thermoleophilaceae bacterium]
MEIAIIVLVVAGVIGLAIASSRRAERLAALERDKILRDNRTLEQLLALSPVEFEQHVADLLSRGDFRSLRRTQATRDRGVDLEGRDLDDRRVVVQCKRYSSENKIGGAAIRDLAGTAQLHQAQRAVFVTTSNYTPDAFATASSCGIELIAGGDLIELHQRAFPYDAVADDHPASLDSKQPSQDTLPPDELPPSDESLPPPRESIAGFGGEGSADIAGQSAVGAGGLQAESPSDPDEGTDLLSTPQASRQEERAVAIGPDEELRMELDTHGPMILEELTLLEPEHEDEPVWREFLAEVRNTSPQEQNATLRLTLRDGTGRPVKSIQIIFFDLPAGARGIESQGLDFPPRVASVDALMRP